MKHRKLNRLTKSQQEIDRLPPWASPDFKTYLEGHGTTLCPETIVYIYREFKLRKELDLCEQCARLLFGIPNKDGIMLGGFCEAVIRKQATVFGFASHPDQLKDFRQQCYHTMVVAINEGRSKRPHIEERFNRFLKHKAIDVGRSLLAQEIYIAQDPDELDVGYEDPDDIFTELTAKEVEAAITTSGLKEKELNAVVLYWMKSYPMESSDPEDVTVCSIMEISSSMARRLLRQAKAKLEQNSVMLDLRERG